ncbi:hypothetical protein R1flu_005354, partial [Riccia fluitans]
TLRSCGETIRHLSLSNTAILPSSVRDPTERRFFVNLGTYKTLDSFTSPSSGPRVDIPGRIVVCNSKCIKCKLEVVPEVTYETTSVARTDCPIADRTNECVKLRWVSIEEQSLQCGPALVRIEEQQGHPWQLDMTQLQQQHLILLLESPQKAPPLDQYLRGFLVRILVH